MFMDQVDLMDLMDNVGAPRDNPRVGSAAVGWDAGGRVTAGVCGQCDGNGGVQNCGGVARAVWQRWRAGDGGVALVSDLSDLSDPSDKVVRHGIPRGFAERSLVWRGREYAGG